MSETVDLAALSIRIDSEEAKRGVTNLGALEKAAQKTETATEEVERRFEALSKQMEEANQAARSLRSGFTSLTRFAAAAAQLDAKLPDGTSFDRVTEGVERLNRALSRVPPAEQQASRAIRTVREEAAQADEPVGRLGEGVARLATRFLSVAAVAAGVRSATQEALGFGTAMAQVSTLLDGNQVQQLGALEERVRALGKEYGSAPTEQARALYEIIASGAAEGARATEVLTVSNKLAIGGVTDIQTAASGLTTIWASYGSQLRDVTEASDVLFVSAAAGKTSVDELARFLGQVTPIAAQTGVSLDELGAAMGALTAAGIKTSTSAEGLRAILAQVAKPSKEAAELAGQLGIDFSTAGLKARGLAGFLEQVRERTHGSTEQMAILMGGVEALLPAMTLTGTGAKAFADTLEDMQGKAGRTEAAFQKMADTPQAKLNQLKARVDDLQISLGDRLLGSVTPGLETLNAHFDTLATSAGYVAGALGILLSARAASWTQEWVKGMAAKVQAAAAARTATIQAALAESGYTRVQGESTRAALANALARNELQRAGIQAALVSRQMTAADAQAAFAAYQTTKAKLTEAAAIESATVASRAGAGALALLGGPVGAVTAALGLAAMACTSFGSAADDAREKAIRFAQDTASTASRASQIVSGLEEETRGLKDQTKAMQAFNLAKKELMGLGEDYRKLLTADVDTVQEVASVFDSVAGGKLASSQQRIEKLREDLEKADRALLRNAASRARRDATEAQLRESDYYKANVEERLGPLNKQLDAEIQAAAELERALQRVHEAAQGKTPTGTGTSPGTGTAAAAADEAAKASRRYVERLEEQARQENLTWAQAQRASDEYRALTGELKRRADAAIEVRQAAMEQEEAEKAVTRATEEHMEAVVALSLKQYEVAQRQVEARRQAADAWERDTQELVRSLEPMAELEARQLRLNQLYAEGRIGFAAYAREGVQVQRQLNAGFDTLVSSIETAGQHMGDAVTEFATTGTAMFSHMTESGKSRFEELTQAFLADITRMMASKAMAKLVDLLSSLAFGGTGAGGAGASFGASLGEAAARAGGAFLGGRASGGPVRAGNTYLVGERGPERFVPHTAGTIVPNRALGGPPVQVNVTTHLQAGGQATADVQASGGAGPDVQRFARLLGDTARRVISDELRPGGLLYPQRKV